MPHPLTQEETTTTTDAAEAEAAPRPPLTTPPSTAAATTPLRSLSELLRGRAFQPPANEAATHGHIVGEYLSQGQGGQFGLALQLIPYMPANAWPTTRPWSAGELASYCAWTVVACQEPVKIRPLSTKSGRPHDTVRQILAATMAILSPLTTSEADALENDQVSVTDTSELTNPAPTLEITPDRVSVTDTMDTKITSVRHGHRKHHQTRASSGNSVTTSVRRGHLSRARKTTTTTNGSGHADDWRPPCDLKSQAVRIGIGPSLYDKTASEVTAWAKTLPPEDRDHAYATAMGRKTTELLRQTEIARRLERLTSRDSARHRALHAGEPVDTGPDECLIWYQQACDWAVKNSVEGSVFDDIWHRCMGESATPRLTELFERGMPPFPGEDLSKEALQNLSA